jgi:ABC-2 type transport system ATP-binding protein
MDEMVQIRNLTKRFGPITAVEDVSFAVGRGEVLGFLGPNGAGKSTTMKMITGFLTPDAGTITVAGDDVRAKPVTVKRRLGYLPEGAPLYGDMTPSAFLDFVAQARGLSGEQKTSRLRDTIAKVQLHDVLNQPIETLSKGFKRRVGLAQAILHDPDVLVLDEPTDGLDPNQKHDVRTLITGMAHDKVIILSTHILEEVEAVCTRAIIIAAGRLVVDATPAELEARSSIHNAVTLVVRGQQPQTLHDSISALDDVKAVEILDNNQGLLRSRVYSHSGNPLIGPLSKAAHRHGWDIAELHVERGRLDEVFRSITTVEEETS